MVVIVQADAVGMYDTKVVVPLVTPDDDATIVGRLAPLLSVTGEVRLLATHLTSVVRKHDLSPPIASLESERLAIQAALDFLLNGS